MQIAALNYIENCKAAFRVQRLRLNFFLAIYVLKCPYLIFLVPNIHGRYLRDVSIQQRVIKWRITVIVHMYRTRAIITHGLYTFYPLFEVHLCTVNFGLMYGQYSRAVSNQEWVIVARVRQTQMSVLQVCITACQFLGSSYLISLRFVSGISFFLT